MRTILYFGVGLSVVGLAHAAALNGSKLPDAPTLTRVTQATIAEDPSSPASKKEIHYPQPPHRYLRYPVESKHYKSMWQDSVKSIYRMKLSKMEPDFLVLPFEVQMRPIDKIGRSLMTRILVDRLRTLTPKFVSDFDTVDRALGYNRPRFLEEDIRTILDDVQPQTYIRTFVGHKNKSQMYVTVQVHSRDPSNPKKYREIGKKSWTELPFDDVHYPYETFVSMSDLVARFIVPDGTEQTQDNSQQTADATETLLPESPTDLVDITDATPVGIAFALQTLGLLTPETASRERHRLFERSLMVLNEVPPSHPDFALLKARALFYLARRPGAVEILHGAVTKEAESFRFYMDANLVGLAKSVEEISSPWKKSFARIELNDLAASFGYEKRLLPSWKDAFFLEFPKWQLIVSSKLNEGHFSGRTHQVTVKKALDELFPMPTFSLEATQVAFARRQPQNYELALTEAVANHTQAALRLTESSSKLRNRVTTDDYVHLIDSIARLNAIKDVKRLIDVQGLPEEALALIRRYMQIYEGHPDLLVHKIRANAAIWRTERGIKRDTVKAAIPEMLARAADLTLEHEGEYFRYNDAIHNIFIALIEDKIDVSDARGHVGRRRSQYAALFPPRYTGPGSVATVEKARRQLAYGHDDIGVLRNAFWWINRDSKSDAKSLMEENRHRFIGHRNLPEVLAWAESEREEKQSMGAYYQAAVDSGVFEWSPYWEVLIRQVARGNYDKALAVIKKYPGFSPSSTENPIMLSIRASQAGSKLLWRGAHAQAMPLFELSASYGTNSAAEMGSLAVIATIRGDYVTALHHRFTLGKR